MVHHAFSQAGIGSKEKRIVQDIIRIIQGIGYPEIPVHETGLFDHVACKEVPGFYQIHIQKLAEIVAFERTIMFKCDNKTEPGRI